MDSNSDGGNIKKRRSSLLAQHALKEGLSFNKPSSLPRIIPPKRNPQSSKVTPRIPTRSKNVNLASLSRSKTSSGFSCDNEFSALGKGVAKSTRSAGKLRRSVSADSIARATPRKIFTPSNSSIMSLNKTKSPMSSRKWADETHAKTLKVPHSSDKKTLLKLASYVHTFMSENNFSKVPTSAQKLMRITGSEYCNIVKEVASLLFGDAFIDSEVDSISLICNIAQNLHYPGALSRSNLKTATVPHSWPFCVTFLAWLCSVVEVSYTAQNCRDNVQDLFSSNFEKNVLENIISLFVGSTESTSDKSRLHEELQKFRQKISDRFACDVKYSVDELESMKKDKQKELEDLKNGPNKLEDAVRTYEKAKKHLLHIQEQNSQLRSRISKYRDTSSLRRDKHVLNKTIESKSKMLMDIKNKVAHQKMKKEQYRDLQNELNHKQIQRQSIERLCKEARKNLEAKQKHLDSLYKQLYERCSDFSCLDDYNNLLSRMHISEYHITPNPFEPDQLVEWTQTSHSSVENAINALNGLISSHNERLKKLEELTENLDSRYELLIQQKQKLQANIEEELRMWKNRESELEDSVRLKEQKLSKVSQENRELLVNIDKLIAGIASKKEAIEFLRKQNMMKKKELQGLEDKAYELYVDNLTKEAQAIHIVQIKFLAVQRSYQNVVRRISQL